jgi:uncharacterized membrane protein YjgN (DUF898 family)
VDTQVPQGIAADPAGQTPRAVPLVFTGSAGEYFRIWVSNLGLTIITLGIYSAWAKVRTKRYFYGNTTLDGSAFEYLADPLAILRGRAIAIGAFSLYSTFSSLFPPAGIILGLVLFAAMPWVIMRSLAFRAYHSSYRNIRFRFTANYGEAAQAFALYPALALLTLGLLLPYAQYRQKRLLIANTSYGTTPLTLALGPSTVYAIYAISIAWVLVGLLVVSVMPLLAWAMGGLVLLFAYAYFSCTLSNAMYNATCIGQHRLHSTLEPFSYFLLRLTNAIGIIASLGLLLPWARVRLARYRARCLTLHAVSDIDEFVSGQQDAVTATGEEFGEMFDIDVGI